MSEQELLSALKGLKVETGSLACMGCGHEHGCSVHGCAILREAELAISEARGKADAMERDFRALVGGWDGCEFCAHCCIDEKPAYRPDEKYLEYCNRCVDGSCFEWRGIRPGGKNGKISES